MTSTRVTTTRDLGFAIRDFCEDRSISQFDGDAEHEGSDCIVAIDISNPDNPVFMMESGVEFTARIVRTG